MHIDEVTSATLGAPTEVTKARRPVLTKQGWIDRGAQDAQQKRPVHYGRTQTNWQAQAYFAGYDAWVDENPDTVVPTKAVKQSVPVIRIRTTQLPVAVIEHINSLRRAYTTTSDDKRAERLNAKCHKLIHKWQMRAMARA